MNYITDYNLSDLTARQVDYLVALADGQQVFTEHVFLLKRYEYLELIGKAGSIESLQEALTYCDATVIIGNVKTGKRMFIPFYSTNNTDAMQIIKKHRISLICANAEVEEPAIWLANKGDITHRSTDMFTAAMLAFIKHKYQFEEQLPGIPDCLI